MHKCPYYYVLEDVMHDQASSTPLSTMSSISNLKILDEDGREGELDDNEHIEVNMPTPTFKQVVGDLPTLKKKPQASPRSLSSDLTELSHLKREQMVKNDKYQKMKFGLEQRKVELLEQELTIKTEKLKAEAAREHLHIAKEQVQLKVDILRQRVQLLKEGVPQGKIDSALPVPDHTDDS